MKYRLKPGRKHWVWQGSQLVRLPAGTEVELTESQAKAFRDRFVPVGAAANRAAAETSSESDQSGVEGTAPTPEPWHEITEMKAPEVVDMISGITYVDDLTAIGDAEAAGKGRKTIFDAIGERVRELTEETEAAVTE